jgi:hypothetical protein
MRARQIVEKRRGFRRRAKIRTRKEEKAVEGCEKGVSE